MLNAVSGISVWSDMNPWIDFIIIPKHDFEKTEEIISKAYDDWWDSEEADCDIPIAEYIGMALTENGIEYEIYFKNGSGEDDV